jgi:hypothetical protein
VPKEPPANQHSIIVFPVRDFVHGDGFAPTDRVTVEVFRAGLRIGVAPDVVPQDDPTTSVFDGMVDVNHPGGACWVGVTPDIRPGDVVRYTITSVAPGGDPAHVGLADQTHVANVVVTQPATNVGGTIVVKGTAQDALGNPLPLDQIQQRIISKRVRFDVNGRRDLRAGALGSNGTFSYDAPGSIHWTATYSGLDQHDQDAAVAGESRILWLGSKPTILTVPLGSPLEGTIYEFGQIPGPAAPCTAPLAA